MAFNLSTLRAQIELRGLWPQGRLARAACYLLGLDVALSVLKGTLGFLHSGYGQGLGVWIGLLTFVSAVLFALLGYRWLKGRLLWRLRNRLIVTYVFIGVTPVVLLLILTLGSFYLFAGQFATFIVTGQINSELQSLEATNATLAHDLTQQMNRAVNAKAGLDVIRQANRELPDHRVTVWLDHNVVLDSASTQERASVPPDNKGSFLGVAREGSHLYLRALTSSPTKAGELTVLTTKPVDQGFVERLATNLGQLSLYASGISLSKIDPNAHTPEDQKKRQNAITLKKPDGEFVLNTGDEKLVPTYSTGTVPEPLSRIDKQVNFPTTVSVTNWDTGDTSQPIVVSVQTRLSKLYERLFASLGAFAPAVEFFLLFLAIVFGVIELIALLIGTRLTRSVTKAVAQLYDATIHINRGDFRHRIPVKSNDQLATLANSFNMMTSSIENLIEEQKQKQRLENELAIAQEVQATLFPQQATQLKSLEVHGFCRPARTVSGDYYDFLTINSDKLLLAVGDISGKGISAALLMATIHSAVRAYSLEGMPQLRETAAVGVAAGSALTLATDLAGLELSPGLLLGLLNHQLYESTPAEKYATLFLGIYEGHNRTLTYSNGGHLPPIVMSMDGSVRRLDCGGTVVGLFDNMTYEQGSVQLHRGDIFMAYSDGVTEPENDYGEFGEQRLVDLLRENRGLSLDRISELVTAAVDDWIGPGEQPDDVTLVLARVR